MLWAVDQPGMDAVIRIPGCPVKMHGKPDAPQKAAPILGEDTEVILKEVLNLSNDKIADLLEKDII